MAGGIITEDSLYAADCGHECRRGDLVAVNSLTKTTKGRRGGKLKFSHFCRSCAEHGLANGDLLSAEQLEDALNSVDEQSVKTEG